MASGTTNAAVVVPLRFTVNLPVSVPGSRATASSMVRLTSGSSSLSVALAVDSAASRTKPTPAPAVTVIDSSPSASRSLTGTTVMVALAALAGIVTALPPAAV